MVVWMSFNLAICLFGYCLWYIVMNSKLTVLDDWWLSQKLKVTYVGVELTETKSGDLRWCLDFRDMDSPAIIILSGGYGVKNVDHGSGFVLCPLYGRKSKAFQAASGTSTSAIISSLVCISSSKHLSNYLKIHWHLELGYLSCWKWKN